MLIVKHARINEPESTSLKGRARYFSGGEGSPVGVSAELRKGIYWTELRIFLAVARSKSFNKAAQELGISHPTVARAVRRLETAINTELLAAGARGVVLTPAGSRLARALEPVDAEIAKMMRRIAQA
jgi:DNA-binding MarR family transcriptional regulator